MTDFHYSKADLCITLDDGSKLKLDDPRAFSIISEAWLRAGWDTKYVYGFSWLGRPIIQLPEDMLRIQEVIYEVKPDIIIETGVAHGGSLIFYASLCAAIGKGRVIGVDIEIRPHNRTAIEEHRLSPMITLVEGSSISPDIVSTIKDHVGSSETVLVLLDSNHLKDHVLAELEAYSPLVSPGSYIVACDGIMKQVVGAPRSQEDWTWNNPLSAIDEFLERHPNFECVEPSWPFNEGLIKERVTYWPRAYLQRQS
ncbi:hydroxylase [Lamprobacter modestohalophilus]|uniref:Hydroxylase n=1 Tax=Lamprobacter modestohalophilus TaxID=1064514 RepID=A0A9X0WCV6_9GAMM|nr:CmcI family methyltransferase [Lamprobacter modestohalophilus]MBK1621327.1 hydroxylase [Lamprobacter modestohalophilus]